MSDPAGSKMPNPVPGIPEEVMESALAAIQAASQSDGSSMRVFVAAALMVARIPLLLTIAAEAERARSTARDGMPAIVKLSALERTPLPERAQQYILALEAECRRLHQLLGSIPTTSSEYRGRRLDG